MIPIAGRVADFERRFYAAVLDRFAELALLGLALSASVRAGSAADSTLLGLALLMLFVAGGLVLSGALLGAFGVSLGKWVMGLRVVDDQTGEPPGLRKAMLRIGIVAVATWPTIGLGMAALAWTATVDPQGRRRGWHDVQAGSVVVDVRPTAEVGAKRAEEPEQLREVVNLTAHSAWRVSFDTGEEFTVEGLALVGRQPTPLAGEDPRHLVQMPPADTSVSATHAQFQVVPDGTLVVMDRGSTNGTILVRAGVHKSLSAGRPTTLLDGDEVRFGNHRMRVNRA